jgi:hypothetical protein
MLFELVVLIHVIKLRVNIKNTILKSVKFHVISGVVSYKSGLIYKILRGMNTFVWRICISSWWSGWSSKFFGLLIHQRRGDRAVGSGSFFSRLFLLLVSLINGS